MIAVRSFGEVWPSEIAMHALKPETSSRVAIWIGALLDPP